MSEERIMSENSIKPPINWLLLEIYQNRNFGAIVLFSPGIL